MKRKLFSLLFRASAVLFIIFSVFLSGNYLAWTQEKILPAGFVYVDTIIPTVKVELRYGTTHNFVGDRIDGYVVPKCILTRAAAQALKKVQAELRPFGLGLKIYDAYRPQQASDHFRNWAADISDMRRKAEFYPEVDKGNLFKDGYIASRSGHSRGSTVDLTLVPLDADSPEDVIDMGSSFDFFGPGSRWDNLSVGPGQRAHRMLLQVLMKKYGFRPYVSEWWHFTLENEPFPDTYFNFPVQ
ncbi:MAG: M15 family metallopeptidase [Candidatus Omnitrophica bacterium]|nr:M15 family metallopeptidase [Candidatus Omnitrophota bacterium]